MREAVLDISLSPSGNKLAYIAPAGPWGEAVYVVDLMRGGEPTAFSQLSEKGADITECDWATEQRLLYEIAGVLSDASPIIAIGDDGKDPPMLTQRDSMRALGFRKNGGDVIALDLDGGLRDRSGGPKGRSPRSGYAFPHLENGAPIGDKAAECIGKSGANAIGLPLCIGKRRIPLAGASRGHEAILRHSVGKTRPAICGFRQIVENAVNRWACK